MHDTNEYEGLHFYIRLSLNYHPLCFHIVCLLPDRSSVELTTALSFADRTLYKYMQAVAKWAWGVGMIDYQIFLCKRF